MEGECIYVENSQTFQGQQMFSNAKATFFAKIQITLNFFAIAGEKNKHIRDKDWGNSSHEPKSVVSQFKSVLMKPWLKLYLQLYYSFPIQKSESWLPPN